MRLVRGRLAGVSVRASFGAGMWVGITLGLVAGSIVGAVLAWTRVGFGNSEQRVLGEGDAGA